VGSTRTMKNAVTSKLIQTNDEVCGLLRGNVACVVDGPGSKGRRWKTPSKREKKRWGDKLTNAIDGLQANV